MKKQLYMHPEHSKISSIVLQDKIALTHLQVFPNVL